MVEAPNGKAWWCENCDWVQPQERGIEMGGPVEQKLFGFELMPLAQNRRKTKQDIRYDMYWLSVMNTEYVDNTHKGDPEGGTNDG
jgi:hypothetical protein